MRSSRGHMRHPTINLPRFNQGSRVGNLTGERLPQLRCSRCRRQDHSEEQCPKQLSCSYCQDRFYTAQTCRVLCGWRTGDTKTLLRLCGNQETRVLTREPAKSTQSQHSLDATSLSYPATLRSPSTTITGYTVPAEACTTWPQHLAATADGSMVTVTKSCASCRPKYGAFTQTQGSSQI